MTHFCEPHEVFSIGIVMIAVTSLFVSECGRPVPHGFLIVSLDRYLFVVSRFSIGARCHPHVE
jgi:hypothetical protein